jgi:hypothetical protein
LVSVVILNIDILFLYKYRIEFIQGMGRGVKRVSQRVSPRGRKRQREGESREAGAGHGHVELGGGGMGSRGGARGQEAKERQECKRVRAIHMFSTHTFIQAQS